MYYTKEKWWTYRGEKGRREGFKKVRMRIERKVRKHAEGKYGSVQRDPTK
jgi:hypothetical protein